MTNSPISALNTLPAAFIIHLEQFSAISLSGEEQTKYLQGQVTCDVTSLNEHKVLNGGHCNAKGKLFSIFRLFNYQGKHFLFQPKSCLAASLAELKKFGVFAKVTISEVEGLSFYAIAGEQAHDTLLACFGEVPDSLNPIIEKDDTSLVYIAGNIDRYLLVTPTTKAQDYLTKLALPELPNNIWSLLEISEGFPLMSAAAVDQYVPQMLNLQAIHGISFKKGCYLGQETVARMQYLGKNKRALFLLNGQVNNMIDQEAVVEMQLGENWRKAGDIIASYQTADGQAVIQAVMANDIDSNVALRIKDDEQSQLTVIPLPYALT